jgi:cobyrinic acid a,c-diamide synthase
VAVPERYLGLTMPHEQADTQHEQGSSAGDPTAQQQSAAHSDIVGAEIPPYLSRLAQHVSKHVDLDLLLEVAATVQLPATDAPQQQRPSVLLPGSAQRAGPSTEAGAAAALVLNQQPRPAYRCRIAVARDEAFCFYYQVRACTVQWSGAQWAP